MNTNNHVNVTAKLQHTCTEISYIELAFVTGFIYVKVNTEKLLVILYGPVRVRHIVNHFVIY
jgi:hypothetical protein